MSYRDLREFITQVDKLGALRRVAGADPRFELGGITEVAAGTPECPALLFDDIKGFPRGVRVFTNATTSAQRAALALGLDPTLRPLDALKAWKEKRRTLELQQPVTIKDAPCLQNSARGGGRRHGPLPGAVVAPQGRRALHRLRLARCHVRSRRRLDQCLDLSRAGA